MLDVLLLLMAECDDEGGRPLLRESPQSRKQPLGNVIGQAENQPAEWQRQQGTAFISLRGGSSGFQRDPGLVSGRENVADINTDCFVFVAS